MDIRYGYWHVIAYDEDGRVKFNSAVLDCRRYKHEIYEWASVQAAIKNWSSFVITFIS